MSAETEFDENYKFGTREVWFADEYPVSIIIPLSPGQRELLEECAYAGGITVEAYIRQAFVWSLDTFGPENFASGARERKRSEFEEDLKRSPYGSTIANISQQFNEHHSELIKVPVTTKAKAEYDWCKERYRFNTYVGFQFALECIRKGIAVSHRWRMNRWFDHSLD